MTSATRSTTVFSSARVKSPVRLLIDANGTLSTAFAAGQVHQTKTLVAGDRIALAAQTTASENGLYAVNASGAPSRVRDLPAGAAASGVSFQVQSGTHAGKIYVINAEPGSDVVGTNNLTISAPPVASHNHAASEITSGTLTHERGGLEADVSAYDGLLRITAGATSAVAVSSFALTVLDDSDAATVRGTIGAASSAEVTALTSGYSRRAAVIARVDNTAAPPTEVSGDRYLLDATGASHADWDGAAANDIVQFDGSSWVATTPAEGWIVYSDGSDTDWLYVDDGSPAWQERTAGGGVTDHGALSGLSDDDHSIYSLADGSRWTTTQTAGRVVMTDGSGNLVVSSVTTTTLAFLDATSSVQTQLDAKLSGATPGTLNITSHNGGVYRFREIAWSATDYTVTFLNTDTYPPVASVSGSTITFAHDGSTPISELTAAIAADSATAALITGEVVSGGGNMQTGSQGTITTGKDAGYLGNVENYGIASQAEAEAGTATNKYMTPQRTAQAIAALETGSGGLTVTAKTAGYTAANGDLVVCDATGGSFNVTMPASPTLDDQIGIYLEHGSGSLVVTVQGNGKVLAEFGSAVALQTPGDLIVFQYDGSKWVIAANGIQTFSLSALTAATVDEDADFVRLHDGDATEDFEKRLTVKEMMAPYIEDSTLGTAAGDETFRPASNDHWTNLPIGNPNDRKEVRNGFGTWQPRMDTALARVVATSNIALRWDISNGSYASKSLSVSGQEGSPTGLAFSADGTKAYIIGTVFDTIYQYTLSTAWDISTGSYASKSLSVSGQDSSVMGLAFSADGTKVYIVGTVSDTIYQYTLSGADPSPLDGVTLANGDRVFLSSQTELSQNGIYDAVDATDPATWTRVSDMAAAGSASGRMVAVTAGTTYGTSLWICETASGSDVVGTNDLTFTRYV